MGFDCEAGNVLSNLKGKVLLIFRSSQSGQQFCDQPNVWSNFLEYNFYDLPTYMLSVISVPLSRSETFFDGDCREQIFGFNYSRVNL